MYLKKVIEDINEDYSWNDDWKLQLCHLLNTRFDEIDFENAKEDVMPFIKKTDILDIWSKEFFKDISLNLKSR